MAYDPNVVRIATTTSVVDSGLSGAIDIAFGAFQTGLNPQQTPPYRLVWTPLGSGAAMDAAKAGNADLVIAHDRLGELKFLDDGYGLSRTYLFYNYFVLVGKPGGPIVWPTTLQAGFSYIANNQGTTSFVSRGPTGRSGTWIREQQIWMSLNIVPPGNIINPPYLPPIPNPQPNPGMAATLEAAAVLASTGINAYTMTDIGTWYAFQHNSDLAPYLTMLTSPNDLTTDNPARDPLASNQYVAMQVNQGALVPGTQINTVGAAVFLAWMLTTAGANNAKDTVNTFKPDDVHQGFFYNANGLEHFPDDPNLIQPVP